MNKKRRPQASFYLLFRYFTKPLSTLCEALGPCVPLACHPLLCEARPHPTLCEALEFEQLGAGAAEGEQFGVSALLGDAALLDDHNTVGVVYGAQAVGYDY